MPSWQAMFQQYLVGFGGFGFQIYPIIYIHEHKKSTHQISHTPKYLNSTKLEINYNIFELENN